MSPLLKDYLNKRIVVVTTDGQCLTALLEGFDKNTNLLLSDVYERFKKTLISSSYIMRGNQVVCCGLLPDESDAVPEIDPTSISPLKDTKNRVTNEHLIWQKAWATKSGK